MVPGAGNLVAENVIPEGLGLRGRRRSRMRSPEDYCELVRTC